MRKPLVIGHRGAMATAPENTGASFAAGWRLGADLLECDVRLSRDKVVVILHDATLDRTTNGRGPVARWTWKKLKGLDAGSWFSPSFVGERLWRLRDLLAWVRAKKTKGGQPLGVVVEIKGDPTVARGLTERVVAELRRARCVRRVLLISFDHGAMGWAKKLCPSLRTGLLFSEPLSDITERMARARADALFPRFHLIDPGLMAEARRQRWFVGTWTVNEGSDMVRLARWGVDAIASNVPDRLCEVRRRG